MHDRACIDFLQHYLPDLGYRWKGFRKVRNQVCKRIKKRIAELELGSIRAYGDYLENHEGEMQLLDGLLDISISRFYRDRGVFDHIGNSIFPTLAEHARQNGGQQVRCWSAGAASGEEAYTLAILWNLALLPEPASGLSLQILATDRNAHMIERAQKGIYPEGSLKELPREWISKVFDQERSEYRIKNQFRQDVRFFRQDIRSELPEGTFDLILCRNLAFTYYQEDLQLEIYQAILRKMNAGAYLIIGNHESLPPGQEELVKVRKCIFRR